MPPSDEPERTTLSAQQDSQDYETSRLDRVIADARRAEARRVRLVWMWSIVTLFGLLSLALFIQRQRNELRRTTETERVRLRAAADEETRSAEARILVTQNRAESALVQGAAQRRLIEAVSTRLEGRFAHQDSVRQLHELLRSDSAEVAFLRATVARLRESDEQGSQHMASLLDDVRTVRSRLAAVYESLRVQQRDLAATRQQIEATGRRVDALDRRVWAKADTTMLNARFGILRDSIRAVRIRPMPF